jgi:gliding motility-associated-like protein
MLNTIRSYQFFNKQLLTVFLITTIGVFASNAQFIVAEGFSAQVLVDNVLVGEGVKTRNISYTGHNRAIALFENGDKAELGLDKGIIISSGLAADAKGPNDSEDNTQDLSYPGDPTLDKIAGLQTGDAGVLKFEFKPQTEDIEFKYIFSSEEYIKYVDRGFNDVFGFFISGPGITGEQNVAKIPGSNVEVTIDNVNHKKNSQFFVMNDDTNSRSYKYLQHNAQTAVLKANLKLQACEWYTIKLAIADVGDRDLDSWVFIGSKSFKHKTGLGSDTSFCSENFSLTLDAGHPSREVLWSNGDQTQTTTIDSFGTYWVRVTTQCGAIEEEFFDYITIYPEIKDISIGDDTLVCGNEVDKDLYVEDRVFQHYKWSNGDTTPSINVNKPGKYWLEVRRDGCTTADTIEISDIEVPIFSLGEDTLFCGDIDIDLRPDRNADDFTWFDGSKNGIKNVTSPGAYWLRADLGVCHYYDTINIDQRTEIDIDIGPPEMSFCETQEVRLSTQINDTSIYEIRWNTGEEVGAITVNKSGMYAVTVRDKICDFTDQDECNILYLSEALDYFVPNAFSPNLDGLNETFSVQFGLSSVDTFSISIYNLWGEQVYQSFDVNDKWDAKWKGDFVPGGTYIWYAVLKTPCLPDEKRYKSGTLTIMR